MKLVIVYIKIQARTEIGNMSTLIPSEPTQHNGILVSLIVMYYRVHSMLVQLAEHLYFSCNRIDNVTFGEELALTNYKHVWPFYKVALRLVLRITNLKVILNIHIVHLAPLIAIQKNLL